MKEQFSRTQMMIGEEGLHILHKAHVMVFGVGGVGGYVAEGLARSGIGSITLVDHDRVAQSNLNRQMIALHSTIGKSKVVCMNERILEINPECKVQGISSFYLPENAKEFDLTGVSYLVDAIDTITAKIHLIVRAKEEGIPIISCMGTGNKRKPALLEVVDLKDTSVCPLAKVMRKELKNRGIHSVKVVYSKEQPFKPVVEEQETIGRVKAIPSSMVFVPAVAGMILASEVVNDLLGV
ncbi:MAG: tRNA threonylcarbamoyladenosine dehydratase [Eubacteriales bacterium]